MTNYKSKEELALVLKKSAHSELVNSESKLNEIIVDLPIEIKSLITESFKYKRIPKEYMLSSILFSISTSIGLTFSLSCLGYTNYGNLYFVIIGSRGDAKSEAIKIATSPLKKQDDSDYIKYLQELKMVSENSLGLTRKQNLIQNATIEAVQKVHYDNPNSIGIAIDELYGLVDKMCNPNSRDGVPWRNLFLEGYTNGYIDVSRKTSECFRLNQSYPTLIGGLQNQLLTKLFANGNLESGFVDRLFFTPKLTENKVLNKGKVNQEVLDQYSKSINNILSYKRQSENPDEFKKQFDIKMSVDAEKLIFDYTQDLIKRQSFAKSVIKEYMSKMQISIHKLCVVVFIMNNSKDTTFNTELDVKDVQLAINLNEFYFLNFRSIYDGNIAASKSILNTKDVIKMGKKNGSSQKALAEVTGLHKGTVSKIWNKL